MSEKRKDSRGRILRDGESQRKNGTYMYRYADIHKRRKYVYAKTLEDLRKQEELVKRDLADGIDYAAGEITVAELVDRYFSLKRGLKQNSLRAYGTAIKRIHTSTFGTRKVKTIKLSDAKRWFLSLHDEGIMQNTIGIVQSVIRPAFEMAVDDDNVTPHVLRHTFCTNAQRAGIDVKSLQYFMGHSNASVTLDVYTHSDYDSAEKAFQKIAMNL